MSMKDPSLRPRDWFDDEVAIDFPSLRSVVERMREAFGGVESEDGGDLLAELRLSAREAFDGVTVPLDVPVRKWCVPCGGRGEVWSEPCASCDGTGEALARHSVRLVVPPRVQDGDRFSLSVSAPSALLTRVEVRVVLS
jgi:DnaJ-class molecular chaperone